MAKIRNGFVTNSSSSSYVVINKDEATMIKSLFREGKDLIIGEVGETEFGWEFETYNDFYDKVNFAYLQTESVKSDYSRIRWREMLSEVLTEIGFVNVFVPLESVGYIDHQSNAGEDMNTEIFDSKENLRYFLLNKKSCINTGNDNV